MKLASENAKSSKYFFPPNLYMDWKGCDLENFIPTARQKLVMQAHEAAVAAGHSL